MFPVSIQGKIPLHALQPGAASHIVARIEQGLSSARPSHIERDGRVVVFRAGMFRLVSSWNLLAVVDRGRIEVVDGANAHVAYDFSTRQMLIVVSSILIAMPLFAIAAGDGPPLVVLPVLAALGWLWLVGMNYLTATLRLRRFLKSAAGPLAHTGSAGAMSCPHCHALYDPADYRTGAEARCASCHQVLAIPPPPT